MKFQRDVNYVIQTAKNALDLNKTVNHAIKDWNIFKIIVIHFVKKINLETRIKSAFNVILYAKNA